MRTTREKYERLMESHKHMQRVNQMLEEKILGMANRLDQEKTGLQTSVASLTTKLQVTKEMVSRSYYIWEGKVYSRNVVTFKLQVTREGL
jgi:hypothetical protein